MTRYTGTPSIRLRGNEAAAATLIPLAKTLLGEAQKIARLAGVPVYSLTRKLERAVIHALTAASVNIITIHYLSPTENIEEVERELVGDVTGYLSGSGKGSDFISTRDPERDPTLTLDVDSSAGVIDWVGDDGRRLTYAGFSRYYWPSGFSIGWPSGGSQYVYYKGAKIDTGVQGILGACIFGGKCVIVGVDELAGDINSTLGVFSVGIPFDAIDASIIGTTKPSTKELTAAPELLTSFVPSIGGAEIAHRKLPWNFSSDGSKAAAVLFAQPDANGGYHSYLAQLELSLHNDGRISAAFLDLTLETTGATQTSQNNMDEVTQDYWDQRGANNDVRTAEPQAAWVALYESEGYSAAFYRIEAVVIGPNDSGDAEIEAWRNSDGFVNGEKPNGSHGTAVRLGYRETLAITGQNELSAIPNSTNLHTEHLHYDAVLTSSGNMLLAVDYRSNSLVKLMYVVDGESTAGEVWDYEATSESTYTGSWINYHPHSVESDVTLATAVFDFTTASADRWTCSRTRNSRFRGEFKVDGVTLYDTEITCTESGSAAWGQTTSGSGDTFGGGSGSGYTISTYGDPWSTLLGTSTVQRRVELPIKIDLRHDVAVILKENSTKSYTTVLTSPRSETLPATNTIGFLGDGSPNGGTELTTRSLSTQYDVVARRSGAELQLKQVNVNETTAPFINRWQAAAYDMPAAWFDGVDSDSSGTAHVSPLGPDLEAAPTYVQVRSKYDWLMKFTVKAIDVTHMLHNDKPFDIDALFRNTPGPNDKRGQPTAPQELTNPIQII